MSHFDDVKLELQQTPRTWLVTGAAGFIGSHLVEHLLRLQQRVVGLDNFATGKRENLDDVRQRVGALAQNFTFIEGDICDARATDQACRGVDIVLHQAALGSVPRSIKDPLATHRANVDGFMQMLVSAKDAGIKRFVYASSSSVYGDEPNLPKVEHRMGKPLSPYAASKAIDEVYANTFQTTYGMGVVGLRYFNVFGPRQDPEGMYAAVIPKWVASLLHDVPCVINGDGETSRDFCFVENAVQANILAGVANDDATGRAYNVAVGARTTLTELYGLLRAGLSTSHPEIANAVPEHRDFRAGDVRHSLANIDLAKDLLGYAPTHDVRQGLDVALAWYVAHA